MAIAYHEVVEEVQNLDLESKLDMQNLLDHWIIEEKRKEMLKNAEISRQEYREGKTKSFTNADELIRSLNES